MQQRKRVIVQAFGPWQVDPFCKVGWEDVYLVLHWPKRNRLYLGPTYMTRSDLLHDIERQEEFASDKKYESFREKTLKYLNDLRGVLARLDADGLAIDRELDVKQLLSKKIGHTTGFALAGVYTAADGIDKKEAERMTDFYLSKLGIKNAKYVWKGSRSGLVVMPVS